MVQKKKINKRGIRGQVSRAFQDARGEIENAKEKADEYIGAHPMQSIAIAAGVGAIVAVGVTALLLHPRRKSVVDRLLDIF